MMINWSALENRARADGLKLFRTPHGVTIYTTTVIEEPMVSLQVHDLEAKDAEHVMMRLVDRALTLLRELHR